MASSPNASERHLKRAALVCLILLCLVGAVFACMIYRVGPFADPPASPSVLPSQGTLESATVSDATLPTYPSKTEGSTEITDANGIVHGTTPDGISYLVWGRNQTAGQPDKVTLAAVGDQIGTTSNFPLARAYGQQSSQDYDFRPFYQGTKGFLNTFDLRFANQETVMAGGSLSGYPIFNSPDACAQALADTGFNLVSFCSNHLWDQGTAGIQRSHEVFQGYPQILLTGSYLTQESRDTVRMVERNGMTFALLSYTCLDNSYVEETAPNTYYLSYANKDVMAEEITRAQSVADAVIVYMHWGDEYTYNVNDQQRNYAQFLADLDVDLVLGSHGHNVQPTQLVTGASDHVTPVVYGMSDYVSGWTLVDTIYSGIFTCDFTRGEDSSVQVTNLTWYPTIEWSDGGDVYVRRLCDMTPEEINANTRITDISQSYYDYLANAINTCGMEIKIVL